MEFFHGAETLKLARQVYSRRIAGGLGAKPPRKTDGVILGVSDSITLWLAGEEAEAGCRSALGFHGEARMYLDYGGNTGHSPIRLDPVGVLVGVSYDDHFIGPRITH
jgi:hypothetical protein